MVRPLSVDVFYTAGCPLAEIVVRLVWPDEESAMGPDPYAAIVPGVKSNVEDTRVPEIPYAVVDGVSSVLIGNQPGPSWVANSSNSEPRASAQRFNTIDTFASPISHVTGHTRCDDLMGNPLPSVPTASIRQMLTPPHTPHDQVSRSFGPPKKNIRQPMTPGQTSLFDALFSLAQPDEDDGDQSLGGSRLLHYHPPGPMPIGLFSNSASVDQIIDSFDQINLEDAHNPQEYGTRLCASLPLDKKVKSNTLPFVLQSYSLWMQQFLFEPVRIIPVARDYILDEYYEGPEARWRMVTTANAVIAITGSTGYTLEDFEVLQTHMHRGFPQAVASFGTDPALNRIKALLAMSTTYEFIAMSLKVFPLSNVARTMQAVAPLFRRACPDPDDRPVNLPSLLSDINIGLEYFATLDVVLGAIINRPMYFRYDTTFPPGVYETIFNLEHGPGLRWTNGIPDRLVITLARMNNLLEDFGSFVDPAVIRELEMEIAGFKSILVASTDPSLAVGRLVVQESWRQAAYIYLYMGLCGADSHDARVINAHQTFMDCLTGTKPGRIPDSFLTLPLPILGIATRLPEDQELLKRRMLALPECSRKGTTGHQFVRMLEYMWTIANESGRPNTWSDLRLASLYVTGV
ncbi:hypothetical protein OPQ81_005105 [Rhizoctonia solani]|nr:hypothetical protein OPQ81_005105 [Rhizoctonia solani]